MKSCCENCLVCYLNEYTTVKIKDNTIIECDSQIKATKENREGLQKEIEKHK